MLVPCAGDKRQGENAQWATARFPQPRELVAEAVNGCQGIITPAGQRLRVGGLEQWAWLSPSAGIWVRESKESYTLQKNIQSSIRSFKAVLGSPESTDSRSVQLMRIGLHQGVRTPLGTGVTQIIMMTITTVVAP